MMTANVSPSLKRLVRSSILYLLFALVAAIVAIRENRPAEFAGSMSGLPVLQDFIYGMGTAMSPPLYAMLVLALLTILSLRAGRRGLIGVVGLTIAGLLFSIGALGEPINLELLNPASFDPLKAVLQTGMILVPLLMAVFGWREWANRRKTS